jgi:DNA repair exonuclease SbcCD ATPase subunit
MSIYVISNDLNIKNNLFKVGRTKDTNTDIVAKYQRYLSGARLLLWYPSTIIKYVEDEREILRIFDSNRNRTPNGFKNEWLSIPFEQLKTKMDEYFGHDGEIFEEEQKRERENRMLICKYCEKVITNKFNLSKHIKICKRKEIFDLHERHENTKEQYENQLRTTIEQYENQLRITIEQYENQLRTTREQYENEIESLKEQLSEFKTQLFDIAKQPKQQ